MSIKELKIALSYEQIILREWQNGDTSLLPPEWSIENQKTFIAGMEYALSIIS